MEENKPDQQEPVQPDAQTEVQEPVENISLTDAITGILTAPGDTFEEVAVSTKKNYWLTPILILIAVSIAASFLLFNDEDLSSSIRDKQKKAMVDNLEKQVKDGKMSKEQMNEALEKGEKFMSKSGPFYYVSITLFPAIGILIVFFVRGLIFWGGSKIFGGAAGYGGILNALGLACIIDSILTIVNIVLSIVMGKLVSVGPSLFMAADSMSENMYKFIGHIDLLAIWYLVVVAIGISKLAKIDSAKAFILVFGLWLIWISLTSFLNFGLFSA